MDSEFTKNSKRGDERSETNDKIMTVRPTEEMHRDMKAAAKKRGLTLNALVIHIFDGWLKKEERSRR